MFQTQLNRLLIVVVLFNLCVIIGCHRSYYRRQADAEAQRLVLEKAVDPRWSSSDGSIEIDPQSRMFNPFSKDHPPIPPDDATSHQLMHMVDGKEGFPHWHANGDTDAVENPVWKSYLPTNEKGQVVLNLEQAYRLALIHSPDYQQQRETLYRSALNVSLERFGFDSQLFSGFNSFLTTQGRLRNGSGSSSTTLQSQIGANGGGANLQRLGITGTNFAVGLANTILFSFAGNNTQSASSLIDFSVIQPLLRGAGRERIMESLTQAERTLLANVRQMERYKRGFFLNTIIGRGTGAGPNLSGNFLGNPGSANFNPGGYFNLLSQQQTLRNQELNVRQLEGVLKQFEELFDNERIDAIQLKQFQQTYYSNQAGLLRAKAGYQNSVDQYKIQLGLPPELEVIVEDPLLDQFKLISDQINDRLVDISVLRENTGSVLGRIQAQIQDFNPEQPDAFEWPENIDKVVVELQPFLVIAERLLQKVIDDDAEQVRADLDKLESNRDQRIAHLNSVRAEIEAGRIISDVDPGLFDADTIPKADKLRLDLRNPEMDAKDVVIVDGQERPAPKSILRRAELLLDEIKQAQQDVQDYAELAAEAKSADRFEFLKQRFVLQIPGLLTELNNLPLEMSRLQAFARSNSIQITDVQLDAEQAIRIARCLRRDWMNARASLVDQYRNIEFVADQLEAGVDLVFQGDIGNTGDNPFKLRYETGQLRAGFRFDAPITRLAERNQYRQALIDYQQARRNFYQFEDSIKANLRNLIRFINQNKVQFELNRIIVQISIDQLEINRLNLERPIAVGEASRSLGPTTAQNLINAINSLNRAQDDFIGAWLNYEVLRRNLDYDLGTMQLDEFGQWLDPGKIDESIGVRAAAMMGIELDCQFCESIGTSYLPPLEEVSDENGESVLDAPGPIKAGGSPFEYKSRSDLLNNADTPELTPQQRQIELQLQRLRMEEELLRQRRQLELLPGPDGIDPANPGDGASSQPEPSDTFSQPIVAPISKLPELSDSKLSQPSEVSAAKAESLTRVSVDSEAIATPTQMPDPVTAGVQLTPQQQSTLEPAVEQPPVSSDSSEQLAAETASPQPETHKSNSVPAQSVPDRSVLVLTESAEKVPSKDGKLTVVARNETAVTLPPPIQGATDSSSPGLVDSKLANSDPKTAASQPSAPEKPDQPSPRWAENDSFGGLLNRFK